MAGGHHDFEPDPPFPWGTVVSYIVAIVAIFGLVWVMTQPAYSQEAYIEELDGNPFARIVVTNLCNGEPSAPQTLETSRGPVVIGFTELNNYCGIKPDRFHVIDLPNLVTADPMEVYLTEQMNDKRAMSPSEPGFIYLFDYVGF